LHGNYLYLAQITECLENAIKEVEFYMNGKSAPQPEQVHMDFASEDAAFENAKFEGRSGLVMEFKYRYYQSESIDGS
jgi:hypothetical protein